MTDGHKVKTQSAFSSGRRAFSRKVTLTCTCGKKFSGSYTGRQGDSVDRLEYKALENAGQVFRAHIPIW